MEGLTFFFFNVMHEDNLLNYHRINEMASLI